MAARNEQPVALFVYIPFCIRICTYCDFNVYAGQSGRFAKYVESINREIQLVAKNVPTPRRAKSLAFGGGTPSILSAQQLESIMLTIRASFEFETDAEITLEANPGTVDFDKLLALRALGVNRLSLGVESFDDARLKQFNRHHNVAESYEAFNAARGAKFDNLNIDLIYGLPGQTLAEWETELDLALALQSEHLSLYALQVEEGTPLARQVSEGKFTAPDPDLAADMFEAADARLIEAGYDHYEISNWARHGFQSRHNLTYWLNDPYIGFGAGAHSSWNGERYENVKLPGEYVARLGRSESVVAARETISSAMAMAETMMLGLRLKQGVDRKRFQCRFDVDPLQVYGTHIAQLESWGLMRADAACISLTPRGRLVSNQVLWRFIPD